MLSGRPGADRPNWRQLDSKDAYSENLEDCGRVGQQGLAYEIGDGGKQEFHSDGYHVPCQLEPFEEVIRSGSFRDGYRWRPAVQTAAEARTMASSMRNRSIRVTSC